ncbi:hypothetical protein C8J57DRAFT_1514847 [Mycena rebaudengoi]|nr:hypothetical protein C8J57DRAFT_1514847 [Mycena rebaudengoi]
MDPRPRFTWDLAQQHTRKLACIALLSLYDDPQIPDTLAPDTDTQGQDEHKGEVAGERAVEGGQDMRDVDGDGSVVRSEAAEGGHGMQDAGGDVDEQPGRDDERVAPVVEEQRRGQPTDALLQRKKHQYRAAAIIMPFERAGGTVIMDSQTSGEIEVDEPMAPKSKHPVNWDEYLSVDALISAINGRSPSHFNGAIFAPPEPHEAGGWTPHTARINAIRDKLSALHNISTVGPTHWVSCARRETLQCVFTISPWPNDAALQRLILFSTPDCYGIHIS